MVHSMKNLALLGGSPRFSVHLHVGQPNIPNRDTVTQHISECLDRKWLTNDGPLVRRFEETVARICGTAHCIATSNGTTGLQLAIKSLKLSGEIIVPAFTFVATPHAVACEGLRPVFCDVTSSNHVADVDSIARLVTKDTSAVLGVHLWGSDCRSSALQTFCDDNNLKLFFDGAHSFACGSAWKQGALSFGECEVLSFHATKFVNCGEGGAVVTNSDSLASELRLLRNFGFAGPDNVVSLGMNGKMSEFHAALGLSSIDMMNEIVATNKKNYRAYQMALQNCAGITLFRPPGTEEWNHQYVVAMVDQNRCVLSRDEIMQVLHTENVLARRYFYPGCHRVKPYANNVSVSALPVTDRLCSEVLILPTGTNISTQQIEGIGSVIRNALTHSVEVKAALKGSFSARFDWQAADE